MAEFKLSICIPTYNFGEFIGETLESIIEQADDEIEIIVGDGASTDNTEKIVKSFQSWFPRLTYEKFEKKGGIDLDLAKTIELANGRYCWLMSSDDVLMPGAIRRILDEIELGHSIYLCNRTNCDRDLNEISRSYWLSNKTEDNVYDFSDDTELIRYLNSAKSLGALFSYISSIIVRREDWDNIINEKIVMGTNYAHVYKLFSIAKNGGRVKYLQDSFISTRLFNDSFMANGIAKRFLIDLNGYQILGDQLFVNDNMLKAFMSVMRNEHKWYYMPGLVNKLSDDDEWDLLAVKLRSYGYNPVFLYVAGKLGRWKLLIDFLRYFRRMYKQFKKH